MALTVRELHNGSALNLHSKNIATALDSVREDLLMVDGLMARFETELRASAGIDWDGKSIDEIVAAPRLPRHAEPWRFRYRLVCDWMKLNLPGRYEAQQKART